MRIVIVEDEVHIRTGMVRLLHQINPKHEVVGKADNGQTGFEIICRERPDLIIVDVRMPDMDGLTMIRKLREEKVACQILVLSAYSEFEYAREAIELGIVSYLLKPLKIGEFKKALEQVEEKSFRKNIKSTAFH